MTSNVEEIVGRQVRERLGSMMIDLMIAKIEIETRDETIKKLSEELEKFKPKPPVAKG